MRNFLIKSSVAASISLILCTWPTFAEEDPSANVASEAASVPPPVEAAVPPPVEASAPPPVVAAAAVPPPVEAAAGPNGASGTNAEVVMGDGSRITLREGDFSIIPPKGWGVYTQRTDLTLLAQPPLQNGMKYQRTLQVASFSGPRYIDAVTAKEFEEKIPRMFAQSSQLVSDYRVRNQVPVDLSDGRKGLLFYTEFTIDSVNLMQAHILISSLNRHYLLTFTDLAEHFEGEGANQYLTEAWDSMVSSKLGSPTPQRFVGMVYGGVSVAVILVLGVFLVALRRRRAGREFRAYAEQTDFSNHGVTQTPESLVGSQISSVSAVSAVAESSSFSAISTIGSAPASLLATAHSMPASEFSESKGKSKKSAVSSVSNVSAPMSAFASLPGTEFTSEAAASIVDFQSHTVKKADKKRADKKLDKKLDKKKAKPSHDEVTGEEEALSDLDELDDIAS